MYPCKEILRLNHLGFSQRQISTQLSISRNTTFKVVSTAQLMNLSWEDVSSLDETSLGKRLFPSTFEDNLQLQPRPDYDYVYEELKKRGVTLKLLWQEYLQECHLADKVPLRYSQFCKLYNEYHATSKATMHIEHKPGIRIEVDWAGTTIQIFDFELKDSFQTYLFVATLPFSQYSYAEALPDMKQMSWINAHVHMLEFFGGVSQMICPDNLKTGVIKHPKDDDPIINQSYKEMAEYYNTAIVPTKPRTPKAKASVEGTVGKVTTHIIAKLRNKQYNSLFELNKAIRQCMEEFNRAPFQKKDGSRYDVFVEEEQMYLLPLPNKHFEYAIWKTVTLPFSYHISHEHMHYSVPYEYIKFKLNIRMTKSLIEVFYDGNRLCTHQRLYGKKGQYSTNIDHMPINHQLSTQHNGETLRNQAKKVGPHTFEVITRLLQSYKVEQQGYNGCKSILRLSDDYSIAKLEQACAKALTLIHTPRYKNIKLIIAFGQDASVQQNSTNPSDITYAHLRGATYFGGEK